MAKAFDPSAREPSGRNRATRRSRQQAKTWPAVPRSGWSPSRVDITLKVIAAIVLACIALLFCSWLGFRS